MRVYYQIFQKNFSKSVIYKRFQDKYRKVRVREIADCIRILSENVNEQMFLFSTDFDVILIFRKKFSILFDEKAQYNC